MELSSAEPRPRGETWCEPGGIVGKEKRSGWASVCQFASGLGEASAGGGVSGDVQARACAGFRPGSWGDRVRIREGGGSAGRAKRQPW
eukprot:scaffold5496_cov112-Isochrysis_galbana.AAC.5